MPSALSQMAKLAALNLPIAPHNFRAGISAPSGDDLRRLENSREKANIVDFSRRIVSIYAAPDRRT